MTKWVSGRQDVAHRVIGVSPRLASGVHLSQDVMIGISTREALAKSAGINNTRKDSRRIVIRPGMA